MPYGPVVTTGFGVGLCCADEGLKPCDYDDPNAITYVEGSADVRWDHDEIVFENLEVDHGPQITGNFKLELQRFLLDDTSFTWNANDKLGEAQYDDGDFRYENSRG